MKGIQNRLLIYVENGENVEENYQNLIKILNDNLIIEKADDLKIFLILILRISENHYKSPNFFDKIWNILIFLKDKIKQTFSNFEIFNIFKKSKRILLFLFEQKILSIDDSIVEIMNSGKFKIAKYPEFFYPEISSFLNENNRQEISNKISENFEEKRRIGQNDEYICELIRKDLIDEFISYFNKNEYSSNSAINLSIFETNSYIIKSYYYFYSNPITLIRYAAFFGSVQIFKYLYANNKEKLNGHLLRDSIHGDNPEIIHILEEVQYNNQEIFITFNKHENLYKCCLFEAIKCHHNDIAIYIQNNWLHDSDYQILKSAIHYFNFVFYPNNFDSNIAFFYFCKYEYISFIRLLLKAGNIDPNICIIS